MIPDENEIYVLYTIIGDGAEHAVELATEHFVRDLPYSLPSESYLLLPVHRS